MTFTKKVAGSPATGAFVAAAAIALTLASPLAANSAEAMRVVRDPGTGELRAPTAAEALAFEKAEAQLRAATPATKQSASRKPGVDIRYPDGTIETPLGEDTMMYSVVSSAPDGTLTMDCLPAKQAQKFVKSGQKTSAPKAAAKASHAHE